MVSPHVSNVFLSVTSINLRTFGNGRCFLFIFDTLFPEGLIIFTFKILSHGISSSPIRIPFHLPYRVFEAKPGSSHELTERANPSY